MSPGRNASAPPQENRARAGAAEGPGDLCQGRGEIWDAGGQGKGKDQSCPPGDLERNKAGLRGTWEHAATPSLRPPRAAPEVGAAVRGQVEGLPQPGWGWAAGWSTSPRLRPRDPHGPARGSWQYRYSASAERAPSVRTGSGAGPTRRPLPLPSKPSLPRPRLLKEEAPPRNLGSHCPFSKLQPRSQGRWRGWRRQGTKCRRFSISASPECGGVEGGGGEEAGVALGLA